MGKKAAASGWDEKGRGSTLHLKTVLKRKGSRKDEAKVMEEHVGPH